VRRDKGLFTLGLVLSFWALALVNFSLPVSGSNANAAEKVKLRSGTLVALKVPTTYKSETVRIGETLMFEVARDVKVNGALLIRQGAKAEGQIAGVSKRQFFGIEGKLLVSIQRVKAVDDTEVPLRGTISEEGGSKLGLAIIGAIVCLPAVFFIKGGSAEVPAGSEVKAYVDSDIEINV
jgi:hypothetical protein